MILSAPSHSSIVRFSVTYWGHSYWCSWKMLPTLSNPIPKRMECSPVVELVVCRPGRYLTKNKDTLEVGKYWSVGSWENYLLLINKISIEVSWRQVLKTAKVMDHMPTPDKCSLSLDIWSHAVSVGDFNNLSWSLLPRLSKLTVGERSSEALAEPNFPRVWVLSSF